MSASLKEDSKVIRTQIIPDIHTAEFSSYGIVAIKKTRIKVQ